MALPEAEELLTWETDITFRVRDKIFAIGGEGARSRLDQGEPRDPGRARRPGSRDVRASRPTSVGSAGSPSTCRGSTRPPRRPAPRGVAADRTEDGSPRRLEESTMTTHSTSHCPTMSAATGRPGTSGLPSTSRTAKSAGDSGRATRSGASGTSPSRESASCRRSRRQGHDRARLRHRLRVGVARPARRASGRHRQLRAAARHRPPAPGGARHRVPADPRQRRGRAVSRTPASTSRSRSTAPRSGPIRTPGSRKRRASCGRAAG